MTHSSEDKKPVQNIQLAEGHQLAISEDGTQITLSNIAGLNMQMLLTPQGPVLNFDAPNVTIRNQGDLHLEADNLHFKTKGDMVQQVGGNFTQTTAGNHQVSARDDLTMQAQGLSIEAHRGELELKASDDLALEGLRILHNVPRKEDLDAAAGKIQTFGEYMAMPAYDPNSPQRLPKSPPRPPEDL